MKDYQSLKNALVNACHRIYNSFPLNVENLIIPNTYDLLKKYIEDNRLSYVVEECLDGPYKINQWRLESASYTLTVKSALKLLSGFLGTESWALIKTISSYPHYTSDIDVLFFKNHVAEGLDLKLSESHLDLDQVGRPFGVNFLDIEIDPQYKVSWTNSDDVSLDFILKNLVQSNLDGIKYFQPNAICDVLIRIGHMPFEQATIRLGELLHIYASLKGVNVNEMRAEALRCGWLRTFDSTFSLLNQIHCDLYGFKIPAYEKYLSKSNASWNFPYPLPYLLMAQGVFEKRAFKKIWGARYILRDRLRDFLK